MHDTFLISRVDSIGDVILTLPVCGYLKEFIPGCRIIFLCRNYTKALVECCEHIDEILIWDELDAKPEQDAIQVLVDLRIDTVIHVFPVKKIALLCKKASIKKRVGTSHRMWHWHTANKLVHFSRKKSEWHEAQLNLMLIKYITKLKPVPLNEIAHHIGFTKLPALKEEYKRLLAPSKCNVILHPKSQGSAREWPIENFASLTKSLSDTKFRFFISGTESEKSYASALQAQCEGDVVNISGTMNLTDFIAFISECDALIAASTGPLHIAAACGIHAIGLYPPMRPIHPGRWAPIGKHVQVLSIIKDCNDCLNKKTCLCMSKIDVTSVAIYLTQIAR